jgi:hypothetical protein
VISSFSRHQSVTKISYQWSKGVCKKKKLPRVKFFISAILAGLTLLCNQVHAYIRKYDITDWALPTPDVL